MWARLVNSALTATSLCFSSAIAAERQPFHISRFSGEVTVNLTVTSQQMSLVRDYDYDVTIGLTEIDAAGSIKFIDQSSHGARVKCLPSKVFVGGAAYVPTKGASGSDWKEDLWESVCNSPLS